MNAEIMWKINLGPNELIANVGKNCMYILHSAQPDEILQGIHGENLQTLVQANPDLER